MSKSSLKVLTIVGTRPEIIRLSRTMARLDEHLTQVIAHTGQNYDYELNEIFWTQLGLRKPDHFMNAGTTSLGETIGDILKKAEEILKIEKPDALLVLGDTNSCLSAYMAKRMHIPIFHMEAGNRSYDFNNLRYREGLNGRTAANWYPDCKHRDCQPAQAFLLLL